MAKDKVIYFCRDCANRYVPGIMMLSFPMHISWLLENVEHSCRACGSKPPKIEEVIVHLEE